MLKRSDFKNLTFEKIPLAPSEVADLKTGHLVKELIFEAEYFSKNQNIQLCYYALKSFSC